LANITFATGVFPGFDDSGVWGWGGGPRVLDRQDGDTYEQTWRAALELEPLITIMMTFNDWNEGTQIEPSLEDDFKYATMTLEFAEQWKGIDLDETLIYELTESFLAEYSQR